MDAGKIVLLGLAGGFILSTGAGCLLAPPPPTRTTNQGGGSLLSATAKVVGGRMTELTPDEVQIVADTLNELNPDIQLTLDDEEAEVVVGFLVENGISSFADVQNLDPRTVQIPANAGILLDNLALLAHQPG